MPVSVSKVEDIVRHNNYECFYQGFNCDIGVLARMVEKLVGNYAEGGIVGIFLYILMVLSLNRRGTVESQSWARYFLRVKALLKYLCILRATC